MSARPRIGTYLAATLTWAVLLAPSSGQCAEAALSSGRPAHDYLAERPECGTMMFFGEGFGAAMQQFYEGMYRALDVVIPDVGVTYRVRNSVAPTLAWPLVFPFGPSTVRHVTRYHCSDDEVVEFKPFRFAPELGVTLANDRAWWLRLGYSVVLHKKGSKLGLVAGIGPTFAWRESRVEGTLSPEIGIRLGACCRPIYLTLLARYEHRLFGDAGQAILIKLGLAYW